MATRFYNHYGEKRLIEPSPHVVRDVWRQIGHCIVIDGLRKSRGHSVILRGHDFRLLQPPTDAISASPQPAKATAQRRVSTVKHEVIAYVPLRVHSHYSFLDSTLSPTAIVELAKRHKLPAVALTDTGNLHGVVEFVQAAKDAGVKPIVGAEISVGDKPVLLYVESTNGYHNLCRLLSRHAERTVTDDDETSVANQQCCPFRREEFHGLTEGLIAVSDDTHLAEMFPHRFYRIVSARECRPTFQRRRAPQFVTRRLMTGKSLTSCRAFAR